MLAAARVTHHRTEDARRLLTEVIEGLKHVFQTKDDVLILTTSGTGAMEAAVVNHSASGRQGDCAGVGQVFRALAQLCEVFGIEVVRYEVRGAAV